MMLAAQGSAQAPPVLETEKEKVNYAVGVDLARNLKRQGYSATQAEALAQGVRDELAGGKLLLTEEELQAALNTFQTELKETRARFVRYVAQENKMKGDTFLAENKKKEGVVVLPNGLQYKILKEGEGKKPAEADTVLVNYRGILIDGTEFDNSYSRGEPSALKVAAVVPGLKQALQLMPVGSKWQLFIPSELAYGEKGSGLEKRAGRKIAPNETLIFELELVAVK
jgi:FKBP-type peptidyl-prolyl cis-trans isomerase